MRPYTDHNNIRIFSQDVNPSELIWHSDQEDRTIEVIGETDWLFQFDNELPIPIKKSIFIPAYKIHRVIKGTGDLKIKINK
jgi:hypothetical protein